MIKRLLLSLFLFSYAKCQKIFITSGNSFVLPSNALASQMIETDSGFVALFQNQKITGSFQFFLVFLNKELELEYKIELENASTEFYNNIDFQYDTLRVFSARSNVLNDQDVIEYGYKVFNFKQKKVNPAYKKIAVREALPSLNYTYSEDQINPFQYHLVKLNNFYHLYYFQKKKVKSIDYTYICVKILDKNFNIINYFQKEITPFEDLSIVSIFKDNLSSGLDLMIKNKKDASTNLYYHVKTNDTLWVSEISSKKFFNKHYLMDKNQSFGILGEEKPSFAYFLNSHSPKDSLVLESIFGNQNYQYNFSYQDYLLGYFPFIRKHPLYSIHNLYVTNIKSKKNVMLPYYVSTAIENEFYVTPVFWDNLCLIVGKINAKNYFEASENPVYTFWNFERQSLVKEFFFNQPFALILSRPFLKDTNGAYFLGKNKDQFMFYKVEIQN